MDRLITVIGGTGLLGRPLAEALASSGWSVRVTSRAPDRVRGDYGEGIEVVRADVDDRFAQGKKRSFSGNSPNESDSSPPATRRR